MGAAGPQFASTIISETKRLENNGKEVTCDDLIEGMCEHWRMSREGKVVVEHYEPTETALANPGHFANMVCYQCGEKGHRRTDCPQDKSKFSGLKCELCN